MWGILPPTRTSVCRQFQQSLSLQQSAEYSNCWLWLCFLLLEQFKCFFLEASGLFLEGGKEGRCPAVCPRCVWVRRCGPKGRGVPGGRGRAAPLPCRPRPPLTSAALPAAALFPSCLCFTENSPEACKASRSHGQTVPDTAVISGWKIAFVLPFFLLFYIPSPIQACELWVTQHNGDLM